MSNPITSPKIQGKEYVNYNLAYRYPFWEKYRIPKPEVIKVLPNSVWVFHWYRPREELSALDKIHLEVFNKAKHLFKSVIIFYASEFPPLPEFDGCYVVRLRNDATRGENASFVEALAQALIGKGDYVYRSHWKGQKSYDHYRLKNIEFWNYIMYSYMFNLEHFDSIITSAITCSDRTWLDPYIAALPGHLGELADVSYQDHPCGSFYVLNCKKFREWASANNVTFDDIKRINADDVRAKPWLVEVLPTALFRESPSNYYIKQSPYHIYDRFILEGRSMDWALRRNHEVLKNNDSRAKPLRVFVGQYVHSP